MLPLLLFCYCMYYALYAALPKSQQYDQDGLMDIFTQYGDHLYSKGDHDGAIDQYIKTIGKLEASYVIRKVSTMMDIFTQYGNHLYSNGDHDGAIDQYIKTIGKLEASYVIRKVRSEKSSWNNYYFIFKLRLAPETYILIIYIVYPMACYMINPLQQYIVIKWVCGQWSFCQPEARTAKATVLVEGLTKWPLPELHIWELFYYADKTDKFQSNWWTLYSISICVTLTL